MIINPPPGLNVDPVLFSAGVYLVLFTIIFIVITLARKPKNQVKLQMQTQQISAQSTQAQASKHSVQIPAIQGIYVLEIGKHVMRLMKAKLTEANILKTKNKAFYINEDIKPVVWIRETVLGPRAHLVYIVDEEGKVFDPEGRAVKVESIDPERLATILDSKIFKKISSAMGGFSFEGILMGIGLGALLVIVMLLFVLPSMGIPITIGRTPVEVKILQQTATQTPIPPPGNYTVGG